MKKKRKATRRYSKEFKLEAVARLVGGENLVGLSRILGIHRNVLYYWLERYQEGVELRGPGKPAGGLSVPVTETAMESAARRIAELERKVGQQTVEVDFLRRAFERVRELRQMNNGAGGTASTERSGQ